MGRIRNTLLSAAIGAALAAPVANAAQETGASPAAAPSQPASGTVAPAPDPSFAPTPALEEGDSLVAPEPTPTTKGPTGGTTPKATPEPPETSPTPSPEPDGGIDAPAAPVEPSPIPSIPSSSCASQGVPPVLIPIYQRAAATYGLGPQGAAVLAGINAIETAFGTNLNVSSAGAMGWMQFIPSSWEAYGVDANGDGVADP